MKRFLEYIGFYTVHKNQSAELCAVRPRGPGSCWAPKHGHRHYVAWALFLYVGPMFEHGSHIHFSYQLMYCLKFHN